VIGLYLHRTICDVYQSTLLLSASLVAVALKSLVGFESMRGSSVSLPRVVWKQYRHPATDLVEFVSATSTM
jgi:hypothetical protein